MGLGTGQGARQVAPLFCSNHWSRKREQWATLTHSLPRPGSESTGAKSNCSTPLPDRSGRKLEQSAQFPPPPQPGILSLKKRQGALLLPFCTRLGWDGQAFILVRELFLQGRPLEIFLLEGPYLNECLYVSSFYQKSSDSPGRNLMPVCGQILP